TLATHTLLIAKNGREIAIDDSAAPILNNAGEMLGVVLVFRDISERRNAERVLEERNRSIAAMSDKLRDAPEVLAKSDRRKDELSAVLSPELRNPLAAMRTAVEILRASPADSPASMRAGDIVNRQLKHMAHLVDDLLEISRINQGRINLRREYIPLL